MNKERIQAIRDRCEKATAGPWKENKEQIVGWHTGQLITVRPNNWWSLRRWNNNRKFIVHAREDIPDLLNEVERLRKALEQAAVPWKSEKQYPVSCSKVMAFASQTLHGDGHHSLAIELASIQLGQYAALNPEQSDE